MADPSDEQLMLAARDGDLAAFDALFRRHYGVIRALCARVTAVESADDLAQETFLRILRHRATFRGEARFTTWSYRIARNVCLEHLARSARDRRTAEAWRTEAETAEPSRGGAASERAALLEDAMRALEPAQREVLVLCRFHGLSFAEIGAVLGCTAGAARVRAHRALAALRERYQGSERER